MAKVIAPNKQYTGLSATVMFVNGVGETDNENLLQWFEEKGYTIEPTEEDEAKAAALAAEIEKKEAAKRLKALRKKAEELGIEGVADKDADTLTAEITAAEQK